MEKRFESSFIRDKETARQLYRYWFYRQPIFMVVHILGAIYCIAGIVGLIFNANHSKEFLPILALFALCELILFVRCESSVRTMVKRDAEIAGGELLCTVSVYDDEIVSSAAESRQSLPLSKIQKVFTTKDFVFILTEANFIYILKKDSFTVGDVDGLIAFLLEKGIKVKGKKK